MAVDSEIETQVNELLRGCESVIPESGIADKLKHKSSLVVKAGFDPTAPDLHFGHLVLLNKLRTFQRYGHDVVFLIGDFTGCIGDPSGRNVTRPQLNLEEVKANATTYTEQVFKILDRDQTRIEFNSSWAGSLTAIDLIELMRKTTLARIIERDDFKKRLEHNQSISLHELIYPLIQAYDSVVLRSDVELGGNDQLFNLLLGRQLQQSYRQEAQVAMVLPLLVGLDGQQKMSKSLRNHIALNDPPTEMFGKLMSLSDTLMWRYFELVSSLTTAEITKMRTEVESGLNPMECKYRLADLMVSVFYGSDQANKAHRDFVRRFAQNKLPDEIPVVSITPENAEQCRLALVLRASGLVASSSEAIRQIRQNAVRIDQEKCVDTHHYLQPNTSYVLQVGKRKIAKIALGGWAK